MVSLGRYKGNSIPVKIRRILFLLLFILCFVGFLQWTSLSFPFSNPMPSHDTLTDNQQGGEVASKLCSLHNSFCYSPSKMTHLILVACHSVYRGQNYQDFENENVISEEIQSLNLAMNQSINEVQRVDFTNDRIGIWKTIKKGLSKLC